MKDNKNAQRNKEQNKKCNDQPNLSTNCQGIHC